jgi:predicted amino acid-binding ACT domain protein
MEQSLDTWMDSVLRTVRGLSPDLEVSYSGPGLEHFRRVARALMDRFADEHLAQAGFLHGIHRDEFEQALTEMGGPQVLTILHERLTLRSLEEGEEQLPERLMGILPGFKDSRAAVLLVLEQLDQVDPDGTVNRWTLDSDERVPSGLPQYRVPLLDWTRFGNSAQQLSFLRSVVEPTARFFGMRHEARVAANIDLLSRDVSRFSSLLDFQQRCARSGGVYDEVLKLFSSILCNQEIRWEWLSPGELHRLPRMKTPSARDFPATGCVLVLVDSADQASSALHRLHEAFPDDRESLRDHLGSISLGETEYLSSRVLLPQSVSENRLCSVEGYVQVEVVRKTALPRRRYLTRLKPEGQKSEPLGSSRTPDRSITVLTPHGLNVVLPQGATVLNFAYMIHKDFIVLARRARVNRRHVGLLHPLTDGDVVWLEVGDTPAPLPNDWCLHAAPGTESRILKQYKEALRPYLAKSGRWIAQQNLVAAGCQVEELQCRLDDLTQLVGKRLLDRQRVPRVANHPQQKAVWWYQQLAILHHHELGQELPFLRLLDRALKAELFDEVAGELLREGTVDLKVLKLPSDVKRRARQARLCPHCRPSLYDSLVGAFAERDFVLHRSGTKCHLDGAAVVVHGSRNPDVYILRTANRTGLAADVFRVFAEFGAEVVDIAATRIGAVRGVFRVQLEQQSPEVQGKLEASLKRLPGVVVVERPGSGKVREEILGGPLPPRRNVRALDEGVEEPFFCGDKIVDDRFFYNMKDQKATLASRLNDVATSSHAGTAVWIRGPKKVGKSSLALSFLREIASRGDGQGEYIEAYREESWTEFAERCIVQLCPQADPKPASLGDAVRFRVEHGEGPLVLVIDEAIQLLMNSVTQGDLEGLLKFRHGISSSPGTLLIWVGPRANIDRLPSPAKHLLQSELIMDVPPLKEEDIGRMLTCQQLALSSVVTVEENLPNNVWHLTGGNPFWVAQLGAQMWQICGKRGRTSSVHFDRQLLDQAQRSFYADDVPFQDRLASEHWNAEKTRLARSVLEILAQSAGRRMRAWTMIGLSLGEIMARLEDAPPETQIKALLEDLEQRGSVYCDGAPPDSLWRLSSLILAGHLVRPLWSDKSEEFEL